MENKFLSYYFQELFFIIFFHLKLVYFDFEALNIFKLILEDYLKLIFKPLVEFYVIYSI